MKLPRESQTDRRTDGRTHGRTTRKHIASAGAYRRRRLKKLKLGAHFDESEFADDVERVIGDDDFTVVVNPTLPADQIVNARRSLVPRIQLSRPLTTALLPH